MQGKNLLQTTLELEKEGKSKKEIKHTGPAKSYTR